MPLSRDHVVWAYRLLLDRDPESEAVVEPKMRGYDRTQDLRRDFMTSPEYSEKNRDAAQMAARTPVIKPLASGVRLFVDLADHAIGLNILREQFEPAELAFAQRQVRPGDAAIDAGAHVGLFTMHLAKAVGAAGHVYAYEPFPPNADLLAMSVEENRFGDRVTLTRAALGDREGQADLVFAEHTLNSGGAFVIPPGAEGLAGHARLSVPVTMLDGLAENRRRIAFVKIDVEGAEPRVIAGAAALLRQHAPALLTEIHHEQLARVSGITAADFFQSMARLGYLPHGLTGEGDLGQPLSAPPSAPVSTVAFRHRERPRVS
jgi:FkbM family methyltransferase